MALLKTAKDDKFQENKMKFFNFSLKQAELVRDSDSVSKYLEVKIDDVKVRLSNLRHFKYKTNSKTGENYWSAGFVSNFEYSIGESKTVKGKDIIEYLFVARKQAVAAKKLDPIPPTSKEQVKEDVDSPLPKAKAKAKSKT